MHLRLLFALLPFLLSAFNSGAGDNSDGDGDGNEGDDGTDKAKGKPEGLTPEIESFFGRLIAKAEREGKRKGQEAAEAVRQAEREQEEAERQRKDQEAKGDYETAKKAIEGERDTAISERDSLKAERDEYKQLVTADVQASWDKLPEEVREAYDGDDDDVLAKKRHMTRMAKVIQKLTAESGTPGNSPNPRPAGNAKPDIRESLKGIRYT